MEALLSEITAIIGPGNVLTGDDVSQRRVDWMSGASCHAGAIVRPGNTNELAAVMRLCHATQQPVVTHGGLTGLVYGAEAAPNELVISLERMNAIESIDPVGGSITVQAGTALQTVREAAADNDLLFALDLGARGSCTIGGNIATNAGGVRVIRYGMMRQQVLGLEAVLADGTVISSLSRMLKNNAGYDLKQLFIGSEGTLGIVTRAVLRLLPRMASERTALVACSSFDNVTKLLGHMGRVLGGNLGTFEVMWRNYYALLTEESGRNRAPLPAHWPYFVIVESLAADDEENIARFGNALELALEAGLIKDAVLAQFDSQRHSIWAIREDIEGMSEQLRPLFTFDVSLPIADMPGYTETLEQSLLQRWPNARCVVFGHLGDGNLHVSISVGCNAPETRRAVELLVYGPLAELGGSVSAEHGIGLEKRDYLSISRTSEEIALMRVLKQALDPLNLLNRRKTLPPAD